MKNTLLCFVALFSLNAMAALSGYYDNSSQFVAVVNSLDVADALGGEYITGVQSLGNLQFEVSTASCVRTVKLEGTTSTIIGPVQYKVVSVGTATCLPAK